MQHGSGTDGRRVGFPLMALGGIVTALAIWSVPGCGAQPTWNPTEGLEPAPGASGTRQVTGRPAAIIDGVPVTGAELFPALAEIAGDQALRELAVDRMLAEELRARSLRVTDEHIEAERDRLAALAGSDDRAQSAVLGPLLESRGLGPSRVRSLLARNAGLRLLVADEIEVTEESLDLAFRVRYGPRSRVRVAVFRTPNDAADALRAIRSRAESLGLRAAFAEIAAERSMDPSAEVGGLLGEISPLDPGLSAALRTAVRDARPGEIGAIVALEQAFALLLVEEELPAQPVEFAQVRDDIQREVRSRAERLAMDALADELVQRAGVTVLDPSLLWSWQRIDAR
ncbi:MAG: peptidylprolyl isomerase [Phycisphaerales bacterium]